MAEDRNVYKIHDNGSLGKYRSQMKWWLLLPDWQLQK